MFFLGGGGREVVYDKARWLLLTESTFERIVHHLGYVAVLSDVW